MHIKIILAVLGLSLSLSSCGSLMYGAGNVARTLSPTTTDDPSTSNSSHSGSGNQSQSAYGNAYNNAKRGLLGN